MAMIESHYCMNVASYAGPRHAYPGSPPLYLHFCSIELGAILPETAMARARDIAARFPAPDFNVTLSRVECGGRDIPIT